MDLVHVFQLSGAGRARRVTAMADAGPARPMIADSARLSSSLAPAAPRPLRPAPRRGGLGYESRIARKVDHASAMQDELASHRALLLITLLDSRSAMLHATSPRARAGASVNAADVVSIEAPPIVDVPPVERLETVTVHLVPAPDRHGSPQQRQPPRSARGPAGQPYLMSRPKGLQPMLASPPIYSQSQATVSWRPPPAPPSLVMNHNYHQPSATAQRGPHTPLSMQRAVAEAWTTTTPGRTAVCTSSATGCVSPLRPGSKPGSRPRAPSNTNCIMVLASHPTAASPPRTAATTRALASRTRGRSAHRRAPSLPPPSSSQQAPHWPASAPPHAHAPPLTRPNSPGAGMVSDVELTPH